MAEKLSTGLRDFLNSGGSKRDFLSNCLMKIYDGAPPADADAAVTGNLLVTISQGSDVANNRDGWGEIVNVLVTSHAPGDTFSFDVTVGSETLVVTRTYTNTPDAGAAADVAVRLCRLFNEVGCHACCTGTDGNINVMAPSRKSLTIALHAGATGSVTITDAIYAADAVGTALNFGPSVSGSMSKTSDVWSGLVAIGGTAGYFRFVQNSDDGTLSTTQRRMQGTISTSGAELNMDNLSISAGKTHTVDTYSVTEPAE